MQAWHEPLPDGRAVELRATARLEGDLAIDGPGVELAARRAAIVARPWVWLRQVHGREVVVVGDGDDPHALAGTAADAVVTTRTDIALAVHGADCGIVGLWSPEGVIGAVHAGWKGLDADVMGAAAEQMRALGASSIAAIAGPCIGPECYEFGPDELERLAERLGPEVWGTTSWGTPALDLPAALAASMRLADIVLLAPPRVCTACADTAHWSHRARAETGRQALLVWLESARGAR